jgi:hypothetical protein
MPALLQNVMRTSLVTCFVPILLVGGVVTSYNAANRKMAAVWVDTVCGDAAGPP